MAVYDQFKQHRARVREPIRAAFEAYVTAALKVESELDKPLYLRDGRDKMERLRDIAVDRLDEFRGMFAGSVWIPETSVLLTFDDSYEGEGSNVEITVKVDADFPQDLP